LTQNAPAAVLASVQDMALVAVFFAVPAVLSVTTPAAGPASKARS